VGAGDETSDTFGSSGATSYDFAVSGPNGFLRTFAGGLAAGSANLTINAIYEKESEGIALVIRNQGSNAEKVSIFDAYSGKTRTHLLHPHNSVSYVSQLQKSFGWYELTVRVDSDVRFQRQLAGHVETGRPSVTDPAIGAAVAQTQEVK
jgi:phospholipase C